MTNHPDTSTRYTAGDLFFELRERSKEATSSVLSQSLPNYDQEPTRMFLVDGLAPEVAPYVFEELMKQLHRIWEPDYLGVLVEKEIDGEMRLAQYSIVDHGLLASIALKYPEMMEVNLVLTTSDPNAKCGAEGFIRDSTRSAMAAVNKAMADREGIPQFRRMVVSINDSRFGAWNETHVSNLSIQQLKFENSRLVQACAFGLIDILEVPAQHRQMVAVIQDRIAQMTPLERSKLEGHVKFQHAERAQKISESCDACTLRDLAGFRRSQVSQTTSSN